MIIWDEENLNKIKNLYLIKIKIDFMLNKIVLCLEEVFITLRIFGSNDNKEGR